MNVFTAVGPCCVGCLASAPNRRRRSFPESTSSPTDFGAESDSPVRFDSSIPSPDDERRCPSAATWSPVHDGRRYTTPPCPRAPLRWWRSASVSGLGQPGGGCLAGGPIGRVFFRRIMLNGPDSGIDDPDTPKRPSAKDPASNQPVPVDEHTWARCTSVASHKRSFLDIAPRPRHPARIGRGPPRAVNVRSLVGPDCMVGAGRSGIRGAPQATTNHHACAGTAVDAPLC